MKRFFQSYREPLLFAGSLLLLVALLLVSFVTKPSGTVQAAEPSISFGAVGDIGGTSNSSGVLSAVPPQNLNFFVALGDLGYSDITPETAWCNFVTSRVGATFPFELVGGNHEDDGPDGLDSNFATCLPDRIGNIVGVYPKEYYYDYPTNSPIARFIFISPNLTYPNEGTYSYNLNTPRYNWTKQAIESARTTGIPWVVVGMHKYCISMVNGKCEIGKDIFNLLISEKVDLYMQAHDHAYARSKQLALTPSCTQIAPGSYNSQCVADDGTDNLYTKGSGTVLMTIGSGGESINSQNPSDPEAGYFTKWMGSNANPTYGFMRFTLTATQLNAQFIKGIGLRGTFTDQFTISANGTTPPPSPTLTPTVSQIPTPTRTPTPTGIPTPTVTPTPTSIAPTPTQPVPTATPSLSPTPTPTSTQTSTFSLLPIEDSYVASDTTTTNFGKATELYVDGSPLKIIYLKFDLSPLNGRSIISANLQVKTTTGAYSGSPDTQVVKIVPNSLWGELTLNYSNRPPLTGTLGSVNNTTFNTLYTIQLTPTALQPYANSTVSLGIDSTGGDAWYINSRETSSAPKLILTVQ